MRLSRSSPLYALATAALLAACSSPSGTSSGGNGGSQGGGAGGIDAGADVESPVDAGPDAADASDDADAGVPPVDTLSSNRDRLLGTYFDFLETRVSTPQSNGLSGSNVTSVCDLWSKLDPSAKAVFLTLTARMQGSLLGDDASSMLWHITCLYRIAGGEGATPSDPGSCGGGEFNRLILSMDAHLHASQIAANQHQGDVQGNGKRDIADIPASSFWRDSHDAGGAHAPFDTSNETEQGAPRGQTQYFADPTSALATSPLGRMDLPTLVDPFAIEIDQDYDCVHASNPLCDYITYGPFCLPQASAQGTAIYVKSYGDFDAAWQPVSCGD